MKQGEITSGLYTPFSNKFKSTVRQMNGPNSSNRRSIKSSLNRYQIEDTAHTQSRTSLLHSETSKKEHQERHQITII